MKSIIKRFKKGKDRGSKMSDGENSTTVHPRVSMFMTFMPNDLNKQSGSVNHNTPEHKPDAGRASVSPFLYCGHKMVVEFRGSSCDYKTGSKEVKNSEARGFPRGLPQKGVFSDEVGGSDIQSFNQELPRCKHVSVYQSRSGKRKKVIPRARSKEAQTHDTRRLEFPRMKEATSVDFQATSMGSRKPSSYSTLEQLFVRMYLNEPYYSKSCEHLEMPRRIPKKKHTLRRSWSDVGQHEDTSIDKNKPYYSKSCEHLAMMPRSTPKYHTLNWSWSDVLQNEHMLTDTVSRRAGSPGNSFAVISLSHLPTVKPQHKGNLGTRYDLQHPPLPPRPSQLSLGTRHEHQRPPVTSRRLQSSHTTQIRIPYAQYPHKSKLPGSPTVLGKEPKIVFYLVLRCAPALEEQLITLRSSSAEGGPKESLKTANQSGGTLRAQPTDHGYLGADNWSKMRGSQNRLVNTSSPGLAAPMDTALEDILVVAYSEAVMHLNQSLDKLTDQMNTFSSEVELIRTIAHAFESAYALFKTAGQSEDHSHLPMWSKFSERLNTMYEKQKHFLIASFRRKMLISAETQSQADLLQQLQKLVIAAT